MTVSTNDMPNMALIGRIWRELPPFEISTYLLLLPIFQQLRPLSFYWTNLRQIPKNKTYLIFCILLTCKITTKYTVRTQRNWPYTICICSISKHTFWRPSWITHFMSGPILVDVMYLLHTYFIHVRQKVQADSISHYYAMYIPVGTGTVVTLTVEIRER